MNRLLGVIALFAALVHPVTAQVSIQVLDSYGRPIEAVRIDAFGRGELISVASTAAGGVAELSAERWPDVRRISLSHLGFQTLIVQADEIPADGVIRLEAHPVELEGLTVEAPELCPINDHREARALWSEVASRYSTETGSRAWSAYFSRYRGRVRENDLHRASDSNPVDYVSAGGPGVIHGGDHTPRSLDDRISTEGYAWPLLVVGGTVGGRGGPALDWIHAYHFASPVFGALHNFAVASESDQQTTLVFCGNGQGSGATINGIVSLVPEEALLAAEWRFENSDHDEGAGGSVSFTSYIEASGMKPHLVASRGLFYRHLGTERPYPDLPHTYMRVLTAKLRWYLHPSACWCAHRSTRAE